MVQITGYTIYSETPDVWKELKKVHLSTTELGGPYAIYSETTIGYKRWPMKFDGLCWLNQTQTVLLV